MDHNAFSTCSCKYALDQEIYFCDNPTFDFVSHDCKCLCNSTNATFSQNENTKEDDLSVQQDENDPAPVNLSQCAANKPVKQKKETG